MKQLLWSFLTVTLLLQSCSKDDDFQQVVIPSGKYEKGYFVVNEGNFTKSNTSVSFVSQDFTVSEKDVFSGVNKDKKLGDVTQSIVFNGALAYIIVNNSNKIEVVDRYTFQSVKSITAGLNNPRYAAFANGKMYVTNWGDSFDDTDDFISIYDTDGSYLEKHIVPFGPEEIIEKNNKIFITHSGGFGSNNKLSVIQTQPFFAIKTIEIGDVPKSISSNGDLLYVLCKGKTEYDKDGNIISQSAGKLVVINSMDGSINKTFDFPNVVQPSNGMVVSDYYYYNIGNNVFRMGLSDTSLPILPFINGTTEKISSIYGLYASNLNIIVMDAKDYNSDGEICVFSTNGSLVKKVGVGIIPSAVYSN